MKTLSEIKHYLAEHGVEIQPKLNGETYRAVRYNGEREERNIEIIWDDTADDDAADPDAVAEYAYEILTENA